MATAATVLIVLITVIVGPSPVCSSVRLGHNDYADSGARGRMPGITIMLDCAPEKTTLGGLAPVKFSRRPRRRLKKAHSLPSQFSAAGKIGKKREKCYENLVFSGVAPAQRGRNG